MATDELDFQDLCEQYLHSDEWRQEIGELTTEAEVAVKAELLNHVRTGDLMAASTTTVSEFASGYGMTVKTLWRSYFIANRKGLRRGPPKVRGAYGSGDLFAVDKPSVFGAAVKLWQDQGVFGTGSI